MKQCTCYALRAVDCTCKPAKYGELYTSPQPKQEQGEPVAWLYPEGLKALQARKCWTAYPTKHETCDIPLYTTPQQRTWVDLDDDDRHELWESTDSDWELMKRVEAKLKSKNNA
jgi:hypothetical protein